MSTPTETPALCERCRHVETCRLVAFAGVVDENECICGYEPPEPSTQADTSTPLSPSRGTA